MASLGILLLAGVLSGCGASPSTYNLGQKITLSPGGSANIESEKVTFTFDKVLNDSRCPDGAMCIWQGQVQVLVTIDTDGSKEQITLTQGGLSSEPASQIYGQYRLEFNITPYPKVNETIKDSDYRLELTVTARS